MSVSETSMGWARYTDFMTLPVKAFGIEGTGSYGAGLSRVLQAKGHTVIEVRRPNRQLRHLHGTSDNPDAEGAARSGLNGQATGRAKTRDWIG